MDAPCYRWEPRSRLAASNRHEVPNCRRRPYSHPLHRRMHKRASIDSCCSHFLSPGTPFNDRAFQSSKCQPGDARIRRPAGHSITGTIVVKNNTSNPIEVVGCGSIFQVLLVNASYHPNAVWPTCAPADHCPRRRIHLPRVHRGQIQHLRRRPDRPGKSCLRGRRHPTARARRSLPGNNLRGRYGYPCRATGVPHCYEIDLQVSGMITKSPRVRPSRPRLSVHPVAGECPASARS